MKTILDLHNIYYSYHTSHGETRALSNLSFSLAPGEFAAVVGPSGCGKSTLLSLICGLMKPQTACPWKFSADRIHASARSSL